VTDKGGMKMVFRDQYALYLLRSDAAIQQKRKTRSHCEVWVHRLVRGLDFQ
jgi:hypothetical protein